ncbi:MAG TPA: N-acetylmuramoyl-L-alanine amidase [Rhizobiaceae bacterium]|nr:N-acetylmuramoyl-L-alanine amidase [Rhizobiaceae bacterium]
MQAKVGRSGFDPNAFKRAGTALACLAASIFFIFHTLLSTAVAQETDSQRLRVYDYKMAGDSLHTRIVIWFDKKPEPKWFLLRDPHRLVIDFAGTAFDITPDDLKARGLVSHVRYGNVDSGRSRIILTAAGPFAVEKLEILENENSPGYRMIADLTATSRTAFEAALRQRVADTGQTAGKADRPVVPAAARSGLFTVVLDAGHGGIDVGAEGVTGTLEKTITLAFALELRQKLEETGKFNVVMTRDADKFLRLDERVRIAREHEADLFISIHADAIRYRSVRGATVYTVSDKASDAEAAMTAARENLSDKLAGIEVEEQKDDVADILVDLIRRETHSFSMRFADSLLGELSDTIRMINNPHRYAGFRVLRAPDVPSVLLEMGYLSNAEDEKLLRSAEWRAKAADSIVAAIESFAGSRGAGG